MSKTDSLFNEFDPVSLKEWEAKIEKDLKGKSISELEYTHANTISLIPYYNKENAKNYSQIAERNTAKPNSKTNAWNMDSFIIVTIEKEANTKAIKALSEGANSLTFLGEVNDLEALLENIMIEIISVNFINPKASEFAVKLKKLCLDRSITFIDQEGSITFDFLGNLARKGSWYSSKEEVVKELENTLNQNLESDLNSLTASNAYYQQSGATTVQQIGIALAHGVEYINLLNDKFSSEELAKNIQFHFAIGGNYFGEIAKLRAFRMLWAKVLTAFGAETTNTKINAVTSTLFWSNKQTKNNMLRATSSAMSAVIGGCDSLTIVPFDTVDSKKEIFSERVATNVQLILKEESYFDKVVDPSKGSYFIENLTEEIAEKGWSFFQEIETKGGYIKALEAGFIQEHVEQSADKLMAAYNEGKLNVVGVNKYSTEDREVTLSRYNQPEMNEIRSLSFLHLS
jgi:methylmalonyl-CoA mutase